MKILITGGNGYVGSHLIKQLLAAGHQVFALVRPRAFLGLLDSVRSRIHLLEYDGSYSSLQHAFASAKPDVVTHLASCFLADHKSDQLDQLIDANIRFGLQLLEAMKENGVHNLINTNTYSQYFHGKTYDPAYLYDATKQAFEDLVYFYHQAHDFKVIHLILYDNYGPADPRKKLMYFFKRASESKEPILMSKGEQKLDLIYVEDAAAAYLQAITRVVSKQEPLWEYYAVRNGTFYSLQEVAGIYERVMQVKLNIEWGGLPYRKRQIMIPRSDLLGVPNWQPRTSLSEGLLCMKEQRS